MDTKKSQTSTITAGIGLAILAAIAAWQFYLFVVFRSADGVADVQGATIHLWVAIGTGLITCVAAFFFISGFRRYDREIEMHITTQGHPLG